MKLKKQTTSLLFSFSYVYVIVFYICITFRLMSFMNMETHETQDISSVEMREREEVNTHSHTCHLIIIVYVSLLLNN